MSELVHLAIQGGVASITLDSPANRNALSVQLQSELLAHLRTALADETVRVVLLSHTGTVFCAGADLKEAREGVARTDDFILLMELLWKSPKPILGRLTGPARAGGVGLLALCDVIAAADTVTFAFSEVHLGVIPAVISVPLRRRLQPSVLRRLFLTGEVFDASLAVEAGLLTIAVAPERLDEEVDRLIHLVLQGAPGALAGTRQLLRNQTPSIADELEAMRSLSAEYFASDEAREGIQAFAQKRPPAWVPSIEPLARS